MSDLVRTSRCELVVALHILLIGLANFLVFWLRFDGVIPPEDWALFAKLLPVLVAVRGLTFVSFRLYEGLWRYTSIWDLWHIIAGVGLSSALFYAVVRGLFGATAYPRSVFLIDSILLIFFLGSVRLTRRIYRELGHPDREKRLLIYGAGDAGERIVLNRRRTPARQLPEIPTETVTHVAAVRAGVSSLRDDYRESVLSSHVWRHCAATGGCADIPAVQWT